MHAEKINFSLLVTDNPATSQSASRAYQFCNAAIKQGHHIVGVFFYLDAVITANKLISPASDETHLPKLWAELAEQHQFALEVCVSAALRRGVVNDIEAKQLGFEHANVCAPFVLSGLGQLAELSASCDRLVQF